MVNREDLLNLEDAARELGVGRTLLYRLIADGDLAAIKHGRRRFIERQEIDAYWARRRDEAGAARAKRKKSAAATTPRTTTKAGSTGRGGVTRPSAVPRPSAA